jgi:hypothetical protein
MSHWRSWLGAVLVAQLVSAPVLAQAPGDWPGAAPPPPPADDGVWVELRASDGAARIERVDSDVVYPVCAAPCRQRLSRSGVYRIGGEGVRPSASFELTQAPGAVTLDVQTGSAARQNLATALFIAGGAGVVVGGFVLFASRLGDVRPADNAPSNSRTTTVGGVVALSGLVLGLIGLGVSYYASTHVTSSDGVTF